MKIRERITLALAVAAVVATSSPAPTAEFDQSHARFDQVLKTNVKDARVDYSALKAHSVESTGRSSFWANPYVEHGRA